MPVPGTADRRAILLRHRADHLQPELTASARVYEEIDQRQMRLTKGIDLVGSSDCARLSFHGGSFVGWLIAPASLITGRKARPMRRRRSQMSAATGASPVHAQVLVSELRKDGSLGNRKCGARAQFTSASS